LWLLREYLGPMEEQQRDRALRECEGELRLVPRGGVPRMAIRVRGCEHRGGSSGSSGEGEHVYTMNRKAELLEERKKKWSSSRDVDQIREEVRKEQAQERDRDVSSSGARAGPSMGMGMGMGGVGAGGIGASYASGGGVGFDTGVGVGVGMGMGMGMGTGTGTGMGMGMGMGAGMGVGMGVGAGMGVGMGVGAGGCVGVSLSGRETDLFLHRITDKLTAHIREEVMREMGSMNATDVRQSVAEKMESFLEAELSTHTCKICFELMQ
ncbi:hypothetical protein B484DRAFT_436672, partial [Ochromonadaceae sp. CCMP2298]